MKKNLETGTSLNRLIFITEIIQIIWYYLFFGYGVYSILPSIPNLGLCTNFINFLLLPFTSFWIITDLFWSPKQMFLLIIVIFGVSIIIKELCRKKSKR